MEAVLTSDLFKKFLKSAVQDLKESNIVNTNRRMKKQHRKSFLGRVKPYSAHMAEVSSVCVCVCACMCAGAGEGSDADRPHTPSLIVWCGGGVVGIWLCEASAFDPSLILMLGIELWSAFAPSLILMLGIELWVSGCEKPAHLLLV